MGSIVGTPEVLSAIGTDHENESALAIAEPLASVTSAARTTTVKELHRPTAPRTPRTPLLLAANLLSGPTTVSAAAGALAGERAGDGTAPLSHLAAEPTRQWGS